MEKIYDVDYFIKKFEAIPENFILDGTQGYKMGVGCAYGQCRSAEGLQDGSSTPEGKALTKILKALVPKEKKDVDFWPITIPARINNGEHPDYQQPTPKQRILAALRDIKNKMSKEQEVQECDATKKDQGGDDHKTKIIHVYHPPVKISESITKQELIMS